MTAAQITKAKLEALELVPENWAKSIEGYQPKLFRRLSRLLDGLETVDGNLAMTAKNLTSINTIVNDLRAFLTQGEYVDIVQAFNSEFTVQQGLTAQYFGEVLGLDGIPTPFAAQLYQTNRAIAIESVLSNASLDSMLLNDVRATLIDAVGSNARYANTLESLQTLVKGNAEKEGQLLRYSRQIVSDTFATTDRAYTQIISEDLGLQFFRWLGGKMKTTRCLCLNLNGQYLHKGEIEQIGLGNLSVVEGLASCSNGTLWAGAMPNTNDKTIFTTAGGYNCQHSILPVSTFSVPTQVGLRAYQSGYFKPTETEKEYFGIT
jgi:hypothetical protein